MALSSKELAHLVGVSPSAVSIVLNNKPGVSDETRQRILRAADEYGYEKHKRQITTTKLSIIQLVIYKKGNSKITLSPLYSSISEGVAYQAQKSGYTLQISYIDDQSDIYNQITALKNCNCDGIILLASEMDEEIMRIFEAVDIPFVVLDNYFENNKYDCIISNNVLGTKSAIKHLINMGHKDICCFSSDLNCTNYSERRRTFTSMCLENTQIRHCCNNIIKTPCLISDAYNTCVNYLKENKHHLPTAIFADNDLLASTCISAISDQGLNVPNDISIIGFGDYSLCQMFLPALTSIHIPMHHLGALSVSRLIKKIRGEAKEVLKIELATSLVVRKSVKNLNL